MQERVRICDIAEELGLSTATVSNVIHGKTNKVSDETVQRVTALLEQRQYIPSMAGILLAQNNSGIIGVFLNDHPKYAGHTLSDGFIASSLDHLSTQIEASGQFMMIKKARCAGDVIRFASMWNMDGIVMLGFCEQDYTDLRRHIRIPIAVYDGLCRDPERLVNLSIDNYGGGYLVGRHFSGLGHRKLLCISDNETGVDRERIEGFRHGAAPGTAGLLLVPMQKEERWAYYRQQLARLRESTAVFAVSDFYALDLMCFLAEQGLRVPDDISVAGFDDTPMCGLVRPALTTVRQDGALCGLSQAAGVMVGKRLGGEDYDGAYRAAKRLMVYGAVGAAVLCTVVVLTNGAYVEIYQVDRAVKLLTRQILLVYALAAPFKVLNMILGGGILRSGGRTAYVMGIDMLGTWGFGVPLGLLGAFVWKLPIASVYLLLSLEECVRFAISMVVFRRKRWMTRLAG